MMNGNHQEIYQEEKELRLGDLIFDLLRHWRSLIALIVLGALLGGGIYLMKKSSFDKSNAISEEQRNWVENYQVSSELKEKMDLAWENRQAYERQRSYNQNSLVMKMDAEHVYTGKLKYYIAAGSNTRLIAEKFNSLLSDSGLAEELNDAAGAESEPQYIRELIGCDTNADNDSSVNIATTENGTAPSTKNVVVTYTVNYMEEDGCRSMLDVIEDKADRLNDQLQEEYGGFTCERLGSSVVLGVNSAYLQQQKTNIDYLQSFASNFSAYEGLLTGQDLEYYQITYLNKEAAEIQPAQFTGKLIKYLIVGIFLMVCLWGVVLVLRYVADKRVKTAEELRTYYHLPVLGRLQLGQPRKGLDGAIDKLARTGAYDSAAFVAETLSLLGAERVMLCAAQQNAETEKLAGLLGEHGMRIVSGLYPSRSAQALETASQADGIVLAVQVKQTAYAEIERCLEICALQNIRILGFVCAE